MFLRLSLTLIVSFQVLVVVFCIPVLSDDRSKVQQERWPTRYNVSMAPYQFPEHKKEDYGEYWEEYKDRFNFVLKESLKELEMALQGDENLIALVEKLQKSIKQDVWPGQEKYDEKPIFKWWEEGRLLHSNHFMWSKFTRNNVRTYIFYGPYHDEVMLFLKNFNHEHNTAVRRLSDAHTFIIYYVLAHACCLEKLKAKAICSEDQLDLTKKLLAIAHDKRTDILNREATKEEKTEDDKTYLKGINRVFIEAEEWYDKFFP